MYPKPEISQVELKNFRVTDNYSDMGDGSFLMRKLEVYACEAMGVQSGETITMTLDTRPDNTSARRFFERHGFQKVGEAALYGDGQLDVQYAKIIRPPWHV